LTGDWIPLNDTPRTLDILQLTTVAQLGSTSVKEGTINIVRIDIASAKASSNNGPVILVEPNAEVSGGITTSIVVMPHVVCEGNGTFRLTPELTATSTTSKD
jgi:hypothetical protein